MPAQALQHCCCLRAAPARSWAAKAQQSCPVPLGHLWGTRRASTGGQQGQGSSEGAAGSPQLSAPSTPSAQPCSQAQLLLLHHSRPPAGSVPPALLSNAPALASRWSLGAERSAAQRGGRAPQSSVSDGVWSSPAPVSCPSIFSGWNVSLGLSSPAQEGTDLQSNKCMKGAFEAAAAAGVQRGSC